MALIKKKNVFFFFLKINKNAFKSKNSWVYIKDRVPKSCPFRWTQTVKTTLKKNIKVIVLTHRLDVSESLVNLRAAGVESSLSSCVRQSSIGSSCYAMSPCLSSSKCQMLFKMAPGPKENNQESVINCE